MEAESLEQMQKRHRQELKDLQGRITNKKKNASKKTRKGVNDECAEMERQLREKQAVEVASLSGTPNNDQDPDEDEDEDEDDENDTTDTPRTEKVAHKVEEKLEDAAAKLHISPPTAHEGPNGGGGGKKRNRQKERLARRAAEQEAASERAEQEVSTMTDHRARESEYMKKMFAANGLVEQDIAPDGHCLFSAIADQLGQHGVSLASEASGGSSSEPKYKTVRRAAAGFMEEHPDDFAPFLDEGEDMSTYVAKMRDTAEWGGQLELAALARRYESEIRVVQDGRTERIGEEEGKTSGRTLWLAYYRHGYGLGEHYNSLRKTAKAAT